MTAPSPHRDFLEVVVPIFEYRCSSCEHRFEKIQKSAGSRPARCPKCGGAAKRLHSAPAIQFKGSGWYITDYARKGAAHPETDKGSEKGKGEEKGGAAEKADAGAKESAEAAGKGSKAGKEEKAPAKPAAAARGSRGRKHD